MSVDALGLSEAYLHCTHLVWLILGLGLMLVTSATTLEEELAILRAMEVGGDVIDRAVMPGLKMDKDMSLRGTALVEAGTMERFGRGANIPQRPLLDEGVLTVGVGAGVEGRNAVLKAKPIIIDIRANLTKGTRGLGDDQKENKKNVQGYSVDGFNLFRYWLQCDFLGFMANILEDPIGLFRGHV